VPDTAKPRRPVVAPITSTLSGFPKAVAKILTSLKHVTFNYTDNSGSTIYGYLDSTRILGMDFHNMQPGWRYVFGERPDTSFVNKLGQKHLITTDSTLNNQNLISYTQKISGTAVLEPVRDLHIALNLDKTFGQTYTELYKDTVGGIGYERIHTQLA